jgi:hypothetical protein
MRYEAASFSATPAAPLPTCSLLRNVCKTITTGEAADFLDTMRPSLANIRNVVDSAA